MDPEDADLFFGPFFSISVFNNHGLNMGNPNTVFQKLQHDMVKILRSSNHCQRSCGQDHIFPLHHPNVFRHYRDQEDPYETRKTLLFFHGRTKRKEDGKVRVKLHKMLIGTPDVIYEERYSS